MSSAGSARIGRKAQYILTQVARLLHRIKVIFCTIMDCTIIYKDSVFFMSINLHWTSQFYSQKLNTAARPMDKLLIMTHNLWRHLCGVVVWGTKKVGRSSGWLKGSYTHSESSMMSILYLYYNSISSKMMIGETETAQRWQLTGIFKLWRQPKSTEAWPT